MEKKIKEILNNNFINLFGVAKYKNEDSPIFLRKCFATNRMKEIFKKAKSEMESLIILSFPYKFPSSQSHIQKESNLSHYARVTDYHFSVGAVLDNIILEMEQEFDNEMFLGFTDNSPFYEVDLAVRAGVGVLGDNGLLITEKYGSWVFVAVIVTSLVLEAEEYKPRKCLECGMCEKDCPGKAINKGKINEKQCLSHITQKKGDIDELSSWEIDLIKGGGSVWGCDICQEVCPMNEDIEKSPHPCFKDGYILKVDKEKVESLKKEKRAWDWRGDNVIKRNLAIIDEN